jgi:hypothetical protein
MQLDLPSTGLMDINQPDIVIELDSLDVLCTLDPPEIYDLR